MKVIVFGAGGRMGRQVCEQIDHGFCGSELAAAVSIGGGQGILERLDRYEGEADVVVDFSHHSAVKELLTYCVKRNLPAVIATTGHTEEEKAEISAAAEKIPLFFSANMSVGVAVLADLTRRAVAMFPEADIEIVETHHNQKLDVPSGTALMLAKAVKDSREEAQFLVGRHENGKRTREEVGIHSIRMGNEVGTHEILITTGNETITLKHQATNRALFAQGALTAAGFLVGRAPGLYDMRDLVK